MRVFFDKLNKYDIDKIFDKQKNNSQACGLKSFLELAKSEKNIIISDNIISYLEAQKKLLGSIVEENVQF